MAQDANRMPRLNVERDRALFDQKVIDYMKIVEADNQKRVFKLKRIRRNNLITGLALGICALSIYGYSMYAVSQESFLDNFDKPKIKEQ